MPEPILDPFTVRFSELTADTARSLVGLATRWHPITLTGARGWVTASHRVIAGTLTLSGKADDCALTITTVPASYGRPAILSFAGMEALRFQDVWDGVGSVTGSGGVFFEDMSTATGLQT